MTILALRAPTFLPDYITTALFESHLLWWIAAAILGAAVMYAGRRFGSETGEDGSRRQILLTRLGFVLLALTVVWIIADRLFDTPRERLLRVRDALAQAAQDHDFDKIVTYLAPNFSAPSIGIDSSASIPRDEISARINKYGVKASRFLKSDVSVDGASALTNLTILTETEIAPVTTTWTLNWDDTPDDWKIRQALITSVNNTPLAPTDIIPK